MNDTPSKKVVLEVARLSSGYDGRRVLEDLSLKIGEGESVTLIGPNGCGKSTFLRSIVGLLPTPSGEVRLDGRSLDHQRAHERVRHGLGYLKQTNNLFVGL